MLHNTLSTLKPLFCMSLPFFNPCQVFVACQKSIPTTAILPELELEDSIDTLKELTEQCRVDAEQAQASVAEDAIAIKKKIMDESWW